MSSKNGEALKVINYWKLIEFLNQKDFTFGRDGGNKYNGKKKKTVITHIHNIYSLQSLTDIGSLIEKDDEEFKGFSGEKADPKDAEIHYCFGGIKRNDFVDYLAKYNKEISLNPEYSASDNTFFAAFSFKTDLKGNYVKESIQISPLLWAVSVWKKNGAFQTREFSLQMEEYTQTRKKLDIEIQKHKDAEGCHISQFIEQLFQNVVDDYVKPQFTYEKAKRNGKTRIGAWSYRRFPSEKDQEKSSPYDYSTLLNSYIADDLELFGNVLVSGQFGDGSEYEKRVIEYVLSASYKEKKEILHPRQTISPKENPQEMKAFFEKVLNVKNAPIAKWPSRFMPALMQQVAVNLAICKDENDGVPIFSVNGPPGTGKTTLLKEIIANNIVERAWLLSEYDDSDSAFAELSFSAGKEANHAYNKYAQHYYKLKNDKINDYGIVVTSCNNAAVENITADLPKSSDLLDSLKPDEKKDRQDIKDGLCEVYNLFDPEKMGMEEIPGFEKSKQEKELYFTRYAKALFEDENTWGLVSAPLGRREKIRNYCTVFFSHLIFNIEAKSRELRIKKNIKKRKPGFGNNMQKWRN